MVHYLHVALEVVQNRLEGALVDLSGSSECIAENRHAQGFNGG